MKQAWIALPVAIITVGSFFFAKLTGDSATRGEWRDVGRIQPGSRIEQTFVVKNDKDAPIVLSGFEQACGVTATIAGNGIILPGQQETLTLQTQAERVRGPGGVRFIMGIDRGGKKESKEFTMVWNVVGNPWFSDAEIWLDRRVGATKTLVAHGLYDAQTIKLESAPKGISVSVNNNAVVLSCDAVSADDGEQVRLRVDGGDTVVNYRIPVYWKSTEHPRLYPEVVTMPANSGKVPCYIDVVGKLPNGVKVVPSNPAISATLNGSRLSISTKGARLDEQSSVSLVDRVGAEIARSTVYIVE